MQNFGVGVGVMTPRTLAQVETLGSLIDLLANPANTKVAIAEVTAATQAHTEAAAKNAQLLGEANAKVIEAEAREKTLAAREKLVVDGETNLAARVESQQSALAERGNALAAKEAASAKLSEGLAQRAASLDAAEMVRAKLNEETAARHQRVAESLAEKATAQETEKQRLAVAQSALDRRASEVAAREKAVAATELSLKARAAEIDKVLASLGSAVRNASA